jgi:hypothetical protein
MKKLLFILLITGLQINSSSGQNVDGPYFVCLDGSTYTWDIDVPRDCYKYSWSIVPKIAADSTKYTLKNGKTNETFQVEFNNGESLNVTIKCVVKSKEQGVFCGAADYQTGITTSRSVQVGYGGPIQTSDIIQVSPSTCGDQTSISLEGPQYYHANAYEWTLPSGWTANTLNAKNITAYPNGANGGSIAFKVTYFDFLYQEECIDNFDGTFEHSKSKSAVFNLHSLSTLTVNPDEELEVSEVPQITYTANSPKPLSGASYYWVLPCGWETTDGKIGSFYSTKSITVNPSGYTGGNITVKANRSCDGVVKSSNTLSKNYDIVSASANSINGPKIVCTSNSVFSLPGQPGGTTTTWTATPTSLFQATSGTGISFTTQAKAGVSGNATITANVQGSCGNLVLTKSVSAGSPSPGWITGNSSICLTEANYYTMPKLDYNTSYSWTVRTTSGGLVPRGSFIVQQQPAGFYGSKVKLLANITGNYRIYCTVTISENGCNYTHSVYKNITVNVPGTAGCNGMPEFADPSGNFTVYPNPSDDYIEVCYCSAETDTKSSINSSASEVTVPAYELKLFNDQQKIVKHSTKSNIPVTTIDIADLPAGNYFLHIITETETDKRQVFVQ